MIKVVKTLQTKKEVGVLLGWAQNKNDTRLKAYMHSLQEFIEDLIFLGGGGMLLLVKYG